MASTPVRFGSEADVCERIGSACFFKEIGHSVPQNPKNFLASRRTPQGGKKALQHIFGFFNGPCIGYCYDLLNRVTYPTELSTSIVMFGVNVGASWVPYLVPFLWGTAYLGPRSLMIVVLMCCMVPIPLLYSALYCRYQKAFT